MPRLAVILCALTLSAGRAATDRHGPPRGGNDDGSDDPDGAAGDRRAERGATAVEYALMAGVIIIAVIGSVSLFTRSVGNMFTTYSSTIPG